MSEKEPYLHDEWNDLPLPDGDAAWNKMELLLDKEENRRRAVPFWFWRYAGLGLLLIGLTAAGWLLTAGHEKKAEEATVINEQLQIPAKQVSPPATEAEKNTGHSEANIAAQPKAIQTPKATAITKTTTEAKEESPSSVAKNNTAISGLKTPHRKRQNSRGGTRLAQSKLSPGPEPAVTTPVQTATGKEAVIVSAHLLQKDDSIQENNTAQKDTATVKDSAATKPYSPVVNNKKKKGEPDAAKAFVWSVGIGLQKAIAPGNQQSSPADTISRKRYFFDYFPSIYVRLQRGRWFAQAELAYSAPQPVQNFSFSQKTTYDASVLRLNTERATLQKLYYHQLSLNLNYHLLRQWSVGVGGTYNRLAGAVTEQEFVSKDVQTGAETVSKYRAPIKGFKDSFLYKTTAGLMLQTDYHWKRFALGLRYTQNMQPFIKYTKPDGAVLNEKNNVLQAVLRFRLF